MASGTRNGVVNREACVVIKVVTKFHLLGVNIRNCHDGADRFACTFARQSVIIICHAVITRPSANDSSLLVGHLTTPVHKVILCHGHALVKCHLFDFSYFNRVQCTAIFKFCHNALNVESTITVLGISLHHITR